jgi:hypothetical protein
MGGCECFGLQSTSGAKSERFVRCRPIHDGAPASRSRRKKVRRRRRMDAKSVLGRVTSALHVGGYEATREAAMAAFAKSLAGGAK